MSPRAWRTLVIAVVATLLTVAIIATGTLLATRADAATPPPAPRLSAQSAAVECWTKGRTFLHIIVRNTGDAAGWYSLTVERDNRTTEHSERLGPGDALLDGYMLRPGETATAAYIRTDQGATTLYYRLDVRPKARCVR